MASSNEGSLEAGKLADLVILDGNPLTVEPMAIKDIKVVETIKEGQTIYRRGGDKCPSSRQRPGSSFWFGMCVGEPGPGLRRGIQCRVGQPKATLRFRRSCSGW